MKKEPGKYAVIKINGNQFKVVEGEEFLVDRLTDPKKIEAEVLLLVDNGKVKIGKPVLKDVKVGFKVIEELEKGKKIDVYKFKAKSRYRKHIGFRPQYTRLSVVMIS
ncbi:50S ribosomal protein L21 [Patescibacteria group bacterium]